MSDNTWNNTGYYYVRVSGRSGAFDPGAAFSLHLDAVRQRLRRAHDVHRRGARRRTGGHRPQDRHPLRTRAGSRRRHRGGRIATEKQALADALHALALRPEVAGVVVDVSTISPGSTTSTRRRTAAGGCPYAKNLVAMALKDVVDSYRPPCASPQPGLRRPGRRRQHDPVLPLPGHRGPRPGVGRTSRRSLPGSASDASLQLNYVLSQDAYGAGRQVNLGVEHLPGPEPRGRPARRDGLRGDRPRRRLPQRHDERRRRDAHAARSRPATTSWPTRPIAVQATSPPASAAVAGDSRRHADRPQRHRCPPTRSHGTRDALRDSDPRHPPRPRLPGGPLQLQRGPRGRLQHRDDGGGDRGVGDRPPNTIVFSQGCHSGYNLVDDGRHPRTSADRSTGRRRSPARGPR